MSTFDARLTTGDVARFDMIIPNDCENGHDRCGTHDSVRQFDDFLAREVPKIQASPAFGADGLIIVVWDEGADPPLDPAHVGAALMGPRVTPGACDAQRLTHYSLLRTLEDGFGITRHLAHAARPRPSPAYGSRSAGAAAGEIAQRSEAEGRRVATPRFASRSRLGQRAPRRPDATVESSELAGPTQPRLVLRGSCSRWPTACCRALAGGAGGRALGADVLDAARRARGEGRALPRAVPSSRTGRTLSRR